MNSLSWRGGRLALALALALPPAPATAQQTQLSKTMRQAIELYDKGKDTEALDRFIDILSGGKPEEKGLAGDYITKINMRMAVGRSSLTQPTPSSPGPGAALIRPKAQAFAPLAAAAAPAAVAPPFSSLPTSEGIRAALAAPPGAPPPAASGGPVQVAAQAAPVPTAAQNAEAMRSEIAERLQARRKDLLERLRGLPGVEAADTDAKVDMLGLPSDLLFQSGVSFRIPQAEEALAALAGLALLSGDAVIMIWPERILSGQPSLVDMRRAMALRSFLISTGVSPARVQANLMGTSDNPPRRLFGFAGLVLQFRYGEKMQMTQRGGLGSATASAFGPLLSVGAHPERFAPEQGEGALVEFSVLDGGDGVAGWSFRILPSVNPEKGVPVQELTGEGPAFHQVYWNGKVKYFGERMPYGRYPCVLTGRDLRGVESTSRLFLVLEPPKAAPTKAAAATALGAESGASVRLSAPAAAVGAAPGAAKAALGAGGLRSGKRRKESGVVLRSKPKPRKWRVDPQSAEAAPPATPPAAPAAPPAESEPPGGAASVHVIQFSRGGTEMTPNGQQDLSRAVEASRLYPLAKLILTGYASSGEENSKTLAEQRAQAVKKILIGQYTFNETQITLETRVLDGAAPKVEIGLLGSQ